MLMNLKKKNKNLILKWDKAATHFPSLSKKCRDGGLDAHMFREDISLNIMPIGGTSRNNPDFLASFQGSEEDVDSAMKLCNSLSRYPERDANRTIGGAVGSIANRVAWQGSAVFQIIREPNSPHEITLFGFTSECLYRIPGFFVQCIPHADRELFGKSFTVLSSQEVWQITIPKALGGPSRHKKVLKRLNRFSKPAPNFYATDLQEGKQESQFDFQTYITHIESHNARLTRNWGWNRRDSSHRYDTEFYYIYRTITFRWAQAILREHIIIELNRLFKRLKIESAIEVVGLITADEILRIRQELVDGKIQFSEAYEKTTP